MKIISFLNNNSTLFLSWYCVLFYGAVKYIIFKGVLHTYLMYIMLCLFLLLLVFIIFSIFYSFYQSIKNININKILAFVLLIFYLIIILIFFGNDMVDISSFFALYLFICINICFLIFLYFILKKQSITIFSYLLFYSINSILILGHFLNIVVHDL